MFKLFLALCFVTTTAFAQHDVEIESYLLFPATVKKLIGDYPKLGTPESQEDFKILLDLQKTRTAQDCAQAASDEKLTVGSLFGGANGILSADEIKRVEPLMKKAYVNSGVNSYLAKQIYKRPRPYDVDKNIKPCISKPTHSYAYPSGHSMVARLYGRIVSQIYPERAELLMKRANAFAWNRVVGGVHHPTDVKSAFILSDHLATKMLEDESFVKEIDAL